MQAYASYSLKSIFDVNALDLNKVGKAFGFSVPPRVNVTVGGGKGGAGKSGKKRKRETDGDEDEASFDEEEAVGSDKEDIRERGRGQGKNRRMETLGQKKVAKEVYKKGREQKMGKDGQQWSR